MINYVFLDLETTGLDADTAFVTEIAAVRTDAWGALLGEFQTMVSLPEGEKVPEFIVGYTGITDEMLEGAPGQEAAMDSLRQFIQDSEELTIVVAQYAPFDFSFIEKYFSVEYFYDTRTMSYFLWPEEKAGLKDITARYGIEQETAHRALSDARDTAMVFQEMRQDMELDDFVTLLNVVGTRPDRMPKVFPKHTINVRDFGKKAGE